MSLTSDLNDRNSALSRFFEDAFPNREGLLRRSRMDSPHFNPAVLASWPVRVRGGGPWDYKGDLIPDPPIARADSAVGTRKQVPF